MDEELIRKLVKYKLNAAGTIVDRLPLKMSSELKDLGRVILESIDESAREIKERPGEKPKPSDHLDNVPIE
jgi:hypothetical protein